MDEGDKNPQLDDNEEQIVHRFYCPGSSLDEAAEAGASQV